MSHAEHPVPQPRKSSLGFWLLLAAGLAGILLLLIVLRPPGPGGPQGTNHAAVGKKLPKLELKGLTGEPADVQLADLSGQVALVNFWGTWCPPCTEEIPHIAALEKAHRGRDDFRVLAVSSGPELDVPYDELHEDTTDFLQNAGLDLPTYADINDQTRGSVEQTAGWSGYPMTVVLDRKGTIRGVWEGYAPGVEQEMEQLVEQLLAEET